MIEILPPEARVPAAVERPIVVATWRDDRYYRGCVQLADGGVWAIDDRDLHRIGYQRAKQIETADFFATTTGLFYFVSREPRQRWAARDG